MKRSVCIVGANLNPLYHINTTNKEIVKLRYQIMYGNDLLIKELKN